MEDELTDDVLTGSFRIWQRKKGHRFSVDDVLTAWQACEATRGCPGEAETDRPLHVDLGCGIGSVLLMVHDRLRWRALGVEAQAVSIALAKKNVQRNGLEADLSVAECDFRDFDADARPLLVTGTPPYFPPGTAVPSPDSQRAYARIEYRGGVEAYLQTARRLIRPDGCIVVCGDARRPERVTDEALKLGLQIVEQTDAYPREGRASLFSIWTLRVGPEQKDWPVHRWTARDKRGARTFQAHQLREYFGLKPNLSEHPSP